MFCTGSNESLEHSRVLQSTLAFYRLILYTIFIEKFSIKMQLIEVLFVEPQICRLTWPPLTTIKNFTIQNISKYIYIYIYIFKQIFSIQNIFNSLKIKIFGKIFLVKIKKFRFISDRVYTNLNSFGFQRTPQT